MPTLPRLSGTGKSRATYVIQKVEIGPNDPPILKSRLAAAWLWVCGQRERHPLPTYPQPLRRRLPSIIPRRGRILPVVREENQLRLILAQDCNVLVDDTDRQTGQGG